MTHALARWVPYYTYRFVHAEWVRPPVGTIRLMFFVVLVLVVGPALGWARLLSLPGMAMLGWFLLRAARELWAIIGRVRWIAVRDRGRRLRRLPSRGPVADRWNPL